MNRWLGRNSANDVNVSGVSAILAAFPLSQMVTKWSVFLQALKCRYSSHSRSRYSKNYSCVHLLILQVVQISVQVLDPIFGWFRHRHNLRIWHSPGGTNPPNLRLLVHALREPRIGYRFAGATRIYVHLVKAKYELRSPKEKQRKLGSSQFKTISHLRNHSIRNLNWLLQNSYEQQRNLLAFRNSVEIVDPPPDPTTWRPLSIISAGNRVANSVVNAPLDDG